MPKSGRVALLIFCFLFLSVAIGVFFTASPAIGQTTPAVQKRPLNRAFLKHMERVKLGMGPKFSSDGHPLGYIPPPVNLSHLKRLTSRWVVETRETALPSKYDLRTLNRITPVKDQGDCGSCWTFATFGSLESKLKLSNGSGTTWDFSEGDLNQYHGFDIPECEGGNQYMSTAYLARWAGPVKEADVPYPYSTGSDFATPGAAVRKHVQDVIIWPDRISPTNNSPIKKAIQTYGAVYVSFQYVSSSYNPTYKSYWYNGTGSNHAVAIVGWDDSFSKTKFKPINGVYPAGNGAFIVKNSWGTSWGDNGYFYMSYYDTSLTVGTSFSNAESTSKYTRIYEYDPLGWVTSLGYTSGDKTLGWFSNIFKAASNATKIKAVSFYTPSPKCPYVIYIYDKVTAGKPRSGARVKTLTGTVANAGYHTIRFDSSPATVTANSRFSVVVKLTTPGYNWPIPLEAYYSGWSSAANSYYGQGFVSPDGVNWSDIGAAEDDTGETYPTKDSICLKAFATAK